MKVAFIGTHGVGKTTLCYELAALLKKQSVDADLVKEVARDCPLPINQDTNAQAQMWILHAQICREIQSESQSEVVVCDRSVLDNYAYLMHAVGSHAAAERIVHDWLPSYDLLLHVPAHGAPRGDGVRDTDPLFQRAIESTVSGLLDRWHIPCQSLAGIPRSRWIQVARAAVFQKLAGQSPGDAIPGRHSSQLDLFATAE